MSIESYEDRGDIIRTLAGIERDDIMVRHPGGAFVAIFDNEYYEANFGPGIESAQPVITARTLDVAGLAKDTPLEVTQADGTVKQYLFKKHEPDGTGMSRVLLKG